MLTGFIKKVFGDRNTRALKDLWPIVDQIKSEYEKIKDFSEQQLIEKTAEFKAKITDETSELRNKISEIRESLKADNFEGDMEDAHDELDSLNDDLDNKYDEILTQILPEAFAVVKATCVKLMGKSWDAAGSKIVWNMIPYDVQLLAVLYFTKVKLLKWQQVKVKRWLLHYPFI